MKKSTLRQLINEILNEIVLNNEVKLTWRFTKPNAYNDTIGTAIVTDKVLEKLKKDYKSSINVEFLNKTTARADSMKTIRYRMKMSPFAKQFNLLT